MARSSANTRSATRLAAQFGAAALLSGFALAGPVGTASADPSSGQAGASRGSEAPPAARPSGTTRSSRGQTPAAAATSTPRASALAPASALSPASAPSPASALSPAPATAGQAQRAATRTVVIPAQAAATATVPNAAAPVRAAAALVTVTPHASQLATASAVPNILAFLVSDGTLAHPDAGLLVGNGFGFDAISCVGTVCNGGNAGLLFGNGGNGWNGGTGGDGGLIGNGGNGGPGSAAVSGGSGGNGGSAWLFGNGGKGGAADRYSPAGQGNGGNGGSAGFFIGNGGDGGLAATGANGGDGGDGGLFLGVGGRGGIGGPGAVRCQVPACTVVTVGGVGGDGGDGGLILGRDGAQGAAPLALDSWLFVGYTPVYPVYVPVPPATAPGQNMINGDGTGAVYPDDTDPTKPYAIPGTVVPDVTLPAGAELGRWGYSGGSFLAPANTFLAQLSLPPSSQVAPYFGYVVADPASLPPGLRIEQSQAAPWFGQPGGGVQYRITDVNGKDAPVQALLDSGFLTYR